jgi:hypothetical protein
LSSRAWLRQLQLLQLLPSPLLLLLFFESKCINWLSANGVVKAARSGVGLGEQPAVDQGPDSQKRSKTAARNSSF